MEYLDFSQPNFLRLSVSDTHDITVQRLKHKRHFLGNFLFVNLSKYKSSFPEALVSQSFLHVRFIDEKVERYFAE